MKFNIKTRDILMGVVIVILLLLLKCSHDAKSNVQADLYLSNYNLSAMNDTIVDYRTSNGALISEKTSLVTTLEDLGKYNDTLAKRIQYLSTQTGAEPIVYIKYRTKVVHDTVKLNYGITRVDSNDYLIKFNHDTVYNVGNERHLSGKLMLNINGDTVNVGHFTLDKDELVIAAEIILSEKDDKIIASVVSSHPGFRAEQITPVTLDPELHPSLKKLNNKRFIIGPYIGIGLSSNMKISPQIGVGLSYKIISFK